MTTMEIALRKAILEMIQREGLKKAPNDDPIDFYKRLIASSKKEGRKK